MGNRSRFDSTASSWRDLESGAAAVTAEQPFSLASGELA